MKYLKLFEDLNAYERVTSDDWEHFKTINMSEKTHKEICKHFEQIIATNKRFEGKYEIASIRAGNVYFVAKATPKNLTEIQRIVIFEGNDEWFYVSIEGSDRYFIKCDQLGGVFDFISDTFKN